MKEDTDPLVAVLLIIVGTSLAGMGFMGAYVGHWSEGLVAVFIGALAGYYGWRALCE